MAGNDLSGSANGGVQGPSAAMLSPLPPQCEPGCTSAQAAAHSKQSGPDEP